MLTGKQQTGKKQPLKDFVAGVKDAVQHVREERQQREEERIQGEVDKRVAAQRKTDAALDSVTRALTSAMQAEEETRRRKEEQRLREEKQRLVLEANKLQLAKADQRFAEGKFSVAYDEYQKVSTGTIVSEDDLRAKVQRCYDQVVIQAKALIAEADGLIANPTAQNLDIAKDKLQTAAKSLKKIKHTAENGAFEDAKNKLARAAAKLDWDQRKADLNATVTKLLDAKYNKNQYQKLLTNIVKYQKIYSEVAQEFLDDADRAIIARLAENLTKYQQLQKEYAAELLLAEQRARNASLSISISTDLKAYNEALAQHKLPEALAKLSGAQRDAELLVADAGDISDPKYLDPKYFAVLVADLEPRVGAFNETMVGIPDIAEGILLVAIQQYKASYDLKDLFDEHASLIRTTLRTNLQQQWHKFYNADFPESLTLSLIRLIYEDLKDIGWGKWWENSTWSNLFWRQDLLKKVSIKFIHGNPADGTKGLLVRIKEAVEGYLVPVPTAQVAPRGVLTAEPVKPLDTAFQMQLASAPPLVKEDGNTDDEEHKISPPYRTGARLRNGSRSSSDGA